MESRNAEYDATTCKELIETLLTEVFDEWQLTSLCFNLYPGLLPSLRVGQSLRERASLIVTYSLQVGSIAELLSAIRDQNPPLYISFVATVSADWHDSTTRRKHDFRHLEQQQLQRTNSDLKWLPESCPPIYSRNDESVIPLWFATNRRPIDSANVSAGFSGRRDTKIYLGSCDVIVPKSHKIGTSGSPWWRRVLSFTDDRLTLNKPITYSIDENQYWDGISNALRNAPSGNRSALLFIHGYNVTFEEAALRTGQIGFDLQFPGVTGFFTWPSQGALGSYVADEAAAEASERYLADFLCSFAQRTGVDAIHIIAHSMGNRILLRAFNRMVRSNADMTSFKAGQLILAAPDIDVDVFCDLSDAYAQSSARTTLYASRMDRALATSGIVHDYPRIGYLPPITVINGIDTVEVSDIDITFLGHGYYAEAAPLLYDIHALLTHGSPPEKRMRLCKQADEWNNIYWKIKA